MGRQESPIESGCKYLAKSLGWEVFKGSGHNGAADGIFLKSGRGFCVEFKREKGGTISPAQALEEQRMSRLGIPYYICDNEEYFRQILIQEEQKL